MLCDSNHADRGSFRRNISTWRFPRLFGRDSQVESGRIEYNNDAAQVTCPDLPVARLFSLVVSSGLKLMNQTHRLVLAFLWFSFSVLLFQSPASSAGDAPEVPGAPRLLPEDTLAYLRVDNADEFRKGLAESPIGQMLDDPSMRPFASEIFQMMTELFERIGNEFGMTLDEMLAIPHGQVAIAAMPGNLSDETEQAVEEDAGDESPDAIRRRIDRKRKQQNSFAGLLLVEAGDNIDRLQSIVDRIESRLIESGYVRRTSMIDQTTLIRLLPPRPGRPEVEYFNRQQTIVFGIGHDTASKALAQWNETSADSTLADRADFTSVMSRCIGAEETRPQITFFLDPYHVIERVVKRGGAAGFVWPIIEELGVGKIRGVGGSVFRGGDDFDDISHLHVLIDTPRDGFFGVLRPETGDSMPPNWVPSDVTSYTSIHWDFATTYKNFDKVLAKFQGADPLKRYIEEPMKRDLDVSVQEDVLTLLSGRYITSSWIETPIKLNSRVQLHAFGITDPLIANALIEKIRDRMPDKINAETIAGNVVFTPKNRPGRGVPEGLRTPEPCLMVMGDWLIFADSRTFLERVSLANSDSLPRLINVPEYELVSSELGGKLDGEKPFMMSFMRGSEYIRQFYELAKSPDTRRYLSQQGEKNPLAAKLAVLLQKSELPPFEKFEKYFAPSGSFGYDEPSGMHLGSFTLKPQE